MAVAMVALMGLVGLAIDAGAIFAERRELSRGADAAVLAIAEDCATGAKPCDIATATATAEAYADANADDGAAAIDLLVLDLDEQSIFVRTKTFDPADDTDQFKLFFMRVLGIDSTTVTAEATAIWNSPLGAVASPLIVSDCEWLKIVASNPPPDGPFFVPLTLFFHDGNTTEDCNAVAGQDANEDGRLAGGFGWLATDGDCTAEVYEFDWLAVSTGNKPPTGCSADELYDLVIVNGPLLIPFFMDVNDVGINGEYRISAVGAFHASAYHFGGKYSFDPPCSGDERCIRGYFSEITVWEGDSGGESRGAHLVKLIA